MSIDEQKTEFIDREVWALSIGAAFQRASVYDENVGGEARREFKTEIHNKVKEIFEEQYKKKVVSSEEHVEILCELKSWIEDRFSHILNGGIIRFGVVQKLLNLYLKYQWCFGLIPTTPHCPFDRAIISKLDMKNPPNWTMIDDTDTYNDLVRRASEKAEGRSLAEWELSEFQKSTNSFV